MTQAVVLVLRPQPGADETTAVLDAAGIAARALPVLETEALPESPPLRALVQRLDEFDAVVFVSPAAVRTGMMWIDRFWPQYPLRTRWLAVGARTRELLESRGVRARAPAGEASAQGLLDSGLLEAPEVERVLVVRGEGGRETLAEGLAERGVRLEHLVTYRRRALRVTLPAASEVAALVASSGEVVDALVASGGVALAECALIVPSARVAQRARDAGFTRVIVADGAGADVTLDALATLGMGAQHTGAAH